MTVVRSGWDMEIEVCYLGYIYYLRRALVVVILVVHNLESLVQSYLFDFINYTNV